jgi:hypothetical protein
MLADERQERGIGRTHVCRSSAGHSAAGPGAAGPGAAAEAGAVGVERSHA